MRAALMERGAIRVEKVDDPVPRKGEIIVKSLACGICGSDLHAARHTEDFVRTSREAGGAFKLTTFDPVILGHEFCAEVVDYGPDTERTWATGSLVCSVPVLSRDDHLMVGYSSAIPGGFAEYMLLSSNIVSPVPAGTPAELAALTEPMAVGLHAVNKANLLPASACLVVGAGPVGLAVIASLKARGVAPIIACEFSERRRALALTMGADIALDPSVDDPYATPGFHDADDHVVFECVGVPGMIDDIFLRTMAGSRIVVVGVCLKSDHSRPLIAINKELNVQYVLGYSKAEFDSALQMVAEGALDVEPMITHSVALDGVADAFASLASPDTLGKVIVKPWA